MIHPRFLEELLSSKPDIDILALTKELEQEEGLTSGQVDRGTRVSQQTRVWRYTGYMTGGETRNTGACSESKDRHRERSTR